MSFAFSANSGPAALALSCFASYATHGYLNAISNEP
jgi:hypothetical protein